MTDILTEGYWCRSWRKGSFYDQITAVEKIAAEEKEDETLSNTINIIRKKINPA